MRLGLWWLDAAKRGAVEQLPVVNVFPKAGARPASPPPKPRKPAKPDAGPPRRREASVPPPKPAAEAAPRPQSPEASVSPKANGKPAKPDPSPKRRRGASVPPPKPAPKAPPETALSARTKLDGPESDRDPAKLEFEIRQTHESAGTTDEMANRHRWSLEVHSLPGAPDFEIVSVTYTLHPTFHDPVVRQSEAPFRLERIGWGTFPVKVDISATDGKVARKVTCEHMLRFDDSVCTTIAR